MQYGALDTNVLVFLKYTWFKGNTRKIHSPPSQTYTLAKSVFCVYNIIDSLFNEGVAETTP